MGREARRPTQARTGTIGGINRADQSFWRNGMVNMINEAHTSADGTRWYHVSRSGSPALATWAHLTDAEKTAIVTRKLQRPRTIASAFDALSEAIKAVYTPCIKQLLASAPLYRQLAKECSATSRYSSSPGGSANLQFRGIPVVSDPFVPEGQIVLVNTNGTAEEITL